jgi:cardiolipin hydrolase
VNAQEFGQFLNKTLDDKCLSRNERRTITDLVAQVGNDEVLLGQLRTAAVQQAATVINHPQATPILEWLEDVLKALQPRPAGSPGAPLPQTPAPLAPGTPVAEVYFSPSEEIIRRLIGFLNNANRTLDICVFTITDDRISGAILAAHRRGVKVRVVTDNEKSLDLGSDIAELQKAGIPLRLDSSPTHMHHKFAIADGSLLLTGSYNWTRSAAMNNQENFIITNDMRMIAGFVREFEKLWKQFQ